DDKGKPVRLPLAPLETIRVDRDGKIFSGSRLVATLAISAPKGGESSLAKLGDGLYFSPSGLRPAAAHVMEGGIETSNVQGTAEMVRMIEGMRTYQTDLQALHTLNDLTNRTVNDMTVIA
ncbi:flagellar basal-body rod protein FlgF, partial [mine drainage metagenome]